jgi:hypothetical protein
MRIEDEPSHGRPIIGIDKKDELIIGEAIIVCFKEGSNLFTLNLKKISKREPKSIPQGFIKI